MIYWIAYGVSTAVVLRPRHCVVLYPKVTVNLLEPDDLAAGNGGHLNTFRDRVCITFILYYHIFSAHIATVWVGLLLAFRWLLFGKRLDLKLNGLPRKLKTLIHNIIHYIRCMRSSCHLMVFWSEIKPRKGLIWSCGRYSIKQIRSHACVEWSFAEMWICPIIRIDLKRIESSRRLFCS